MSPTLTNILAGNAASITDLLANTDSPAFARKRLMVLAMLSRLAAQEADTAAAVRRAETEAIMEVLDRARDAYHLGPGPASSDGESLGELDARNARARTLLAELHDAVERESDRSLHREILALHCRMALGRELRLPRIMADAPGAR